MINYIFISVLCIALAIWVQFAMRWFFRLLLSKNKANLKPETVKSEDPVMVVYNGQNHDNSHELTDSSNQELEKVS